MSDQEIKTKKMALTLMGIPLTAQVPATIKDYCLCAGISEGEAVDLLNSYYIYRSPASQWREKFAEAVEAQTGIAREATENEKGKKVYKKTETKYFEQDVCAEDTGYSPDSFKDIAEQILETINTLPSASSGRISQQWLDTADSYLAVMTEDPEKAVRVQGHLGKKGVLLTLNPETNLPSQRELAAALRSFEEINQREQADALLGA